MNAEDCGTCEDCGTKYRWGTLCCPACFPGCEECDEGVASAVESSDLIGQLRAMRRGAEIALLLFHEGATEKHREVKWLFDDTETAKSALGAIKSWLYETMVSQEILTVTEVEKRIKKMLVYMTRKRDERKAP